MYNENKNIRPNKSAVLTSLIYNRTSLMNKSLFLEVLYSNHIFPPKHAKLN